MNDQRENLQCQCVILTFLFLQLVCCTVKKVFRTLFASVISLVDVLILRMKMTLTSGQKKRVTKCCELCLAVDVMT